MRGEDEGYVGSRVSVIAIRNRDSKVHSEPTTADSVAIAITTVISVILLTFNLFLIVPTILTILIMLTTTAMLLL